MSLAPALSAATPPSALRSRDFRLYVLGKLVATLALQMQGVAVGWQVYAITGDALSLGYVGLVQFLPAVVMSLLTGHVADRFDRRDVLVCCHALLLTASGLLLFGARSGAPSLTAI